MPTITALLPKVRRRYTLDLYLDGAFALSLHRTLAQEASLFVGRELSPEEATFLTEREGFRSALDAAYRFLAYRPRSEAEVRGRLRRRKVDPGLIEQAVAKLKDQRLIDDAAFAHQWTENRAGHSPRGRKLVRWELRQKGIESELADEATAELDDEAAAYQAAARRASRGTAGDYQTFRKRLSDFLLRRGFGYDVAARTVERLWRERDEGDA